MAIPVGRGSTCAGRRPSQIRISPSGAGRRSSQTQNSPSGARRRSGPIENSPTGARRRSSPIEIPRPARDEGRAISHERGCARDEGRADLDERRPAADEAKGSRCAPALRPRARTICCAGLRSILLRGPAGAPENRGLCRAALAHLPTGARHAQDNVPPPPRALVFPPRRAPRRPAAKTVAHRRLHRYNAPHRRNVIWAPPVRLITSYPHAAGRHRICLPANSSPSDRLAAARARSVLRRSLRRVRVVEVWYVSRRRASAPGAIWDVAFRRPFAPVPRRHVFSVRTIHEWRPDKDRVHVGSDSSRAHSRRGRLMETSHRYRFSPVVAAVGHVDNPPMHRTGPAV
jgi:hypothetical protein